MIFSIVLLNGGDIMDEYKYIHDILYEWSKELKTPKKALGRQRRTLLKIFSGKDRNKCIVKNAVKKFRITR